MITLIFILIVVYVGFDARYNFRFERLNTGEWVVWYNNHGRYSEGRTYVKLKNIFKNEN